LIFEAILRKFNLTFGEKEQKEISSKDILTFIQDFKCLMKRSILNAGSIAACQSQGINY
jgi:hypothetical protein